MATDEILEQIDKLKMMVMMDDRRPEKTEVQAYEEWVDEIQCRRVRCNHYFFEHCALCDPKKWAEYRALRSLVENLYHQKYSGSRKYAENKQEMRKIIAEIVAMTMYTQEKV